MDNTYADTRLSNGPLRGGSMALRSDSVIRACRRAAIPTVRG